MRAPLRSLIGMLVALAMAGGSVPADAAFGWRRVNPGGNPLISRGAEALEAGRIEEGIRLTQEGLERALTVRVAAVGFANLCAGYAMLKRWDDALPRCNRAIALDPRDWRPYNNRAAVFAAHAQFELAIADVETGLSIAPDSPVLMKSLEVVLESKRIQRERLRTARPA
jgi:tetratricopeptide (TPR) repeat protein